MSQSVGGTLSPVTQLTRQTLQDQISFWEGCLQMVSKPQEQQYLQQVLSGLRQIQTHWSELSQTFEGQKITGTGSQVTQASR